MHVPIFCSVLFFFFFWVCSALAGWGPEEGQKKKYIYIYSVGSRFYGGGEVVQFFFFGPFLGSEGGMPGGGGGKGREGRGSGRLEKVLSILPLAAFWDPNKAGFVFLWGLKYSVTYRLRDRVLWCRRALQARRAASPGPSAWKQCCVFCGQHNIAQSYSPMDPKSYPVLLYPAPITFSDLPSWGLDGMPPIVVFCWAGVRCPQPRNCCGKSSGIVAAGGYLEIDNGIPWRQASRGR